MKEPMTPRDIEIHRKNVREYHEKIAGLEAELACQQEGLREYLNRHNLNKVDFDKAYPV